MTRPSLLDMADALTITDPAYPWVGPTEEEAEVAEVLREMQQLHMPGREDPDDPADDPLVQAFGSCLGCGEQWPCLAVLEQEREGVLWLGRAAARVHAHALGPIDPMLRALPPPRSPCNLEIPTRRELEGTTT